MPWGISLDGLLASEIRENIKAAARVSGTDYEPYSLDTVPEDLDLPLAAAQATAPTGGIGRRRSPTRRTRCRVRMCSTGPRVRISRHSVRCRISCRRWCPNARAGTARG
nr:hypothetical protein GCM10017611_03220 [Rhodococcus wratislaviensis]